MTKNQAPGFGKTNFNDKRLDDRFVKIYEEFKKNPSAILSHVFFNSHQCKAAYRFFQIPKITEEEMLRSHHDTLFDFLISDKCEEILEIQDTTECDYTNHPKTANLGKLGSSKDYRNGIKCHSSLIVTANGLPLGIGSLNLWNRTEFKYNGSKNIRKIPIKEKESFKWINGIENFDTCHLKNLSRIIICDREADFYEFQDYICNNNKGMVIRLRWDRKTEDGLMIKESLKQTPIQGYETIKIKSKGGLGASREEKEVKLAVRYTTLSMKAPKNIDKSTINSKKLKLTIVHAIEVNPENNEEPVEWNLITNVEVNGLEDALKIIRWYSYRWLVEEFHKILKAGIKVEEARLSEAGRLEKLITFLSIIAVRILWMSRINRLNPEAPIEFMLSEQETVVLTGHAKKKAKKELKNINDAVRYIASLGGFKGRKSDGSPGLLTLWRGLIKFYDMLEGYDIT